MKKLLYLFICCMLVLSACSKEESEVGGETALPATKEFPYFYGVKRPVENENAITAKGVVQNSKTWPVGATIRFKFLDGNDADVRKLMKYASEWFQYTNLRFSLVDYNSDADVRITFESDSRWVTWSYTGTDCLTVTDQTEPTVNFADWTYKMEEEIRGDVLRVFGQIMGLELEHRNTNFAPMWKPENRVAGYWDWQIDTSDLNWNELKPYVFDPLEADSVTQTAAYDPNSIMVWPFPVSVLSNTTTTDYNNTLSDQDIAFVKQLYPDNPLLFMRTDQRLSVIWGAKNSEIVIDYGDGHILTLPMGGSFYWRYSSYFTDMNRVIRVYGEPDALTDFTCDSNGLTEIVFGDNSELRRIQCHNNLLTELDVSAGLPSLDGLVCRDNLLTELDVSGLPSLSGLSCAGNPLIADWSALSALVNSLPDRSASPYPYNRNTLWIGAPALTLPASISSVAAGKNWEIHE